MQDLPNGVNCCEVRGVNRQSKKNSNLAMVWRDPNSSVRTVRPDIRTMIVQSARRARHGDRNFHDYFFISKNNFTVESQNKSDF